MNVLSVGIVWVSIAVALIILMKAQAQNLAKIKTELGDSRRVLSANGAHLLELSARLYDVDAVKDGLLSQLSHELRTPIAAIQQSAKVIKKYGNSKPDMASTFSDKILRETDRLTGMIETLLGVVKPAFSAKTDDSAKALGGDSKHLQPDL